VVAQQDEMLHKTLELGGNPDIANKQNQTPLHMACERGDVMLVDALLDANASVNTMDAALRSPLMSAVANADPNVPCSDLAEIVELLVSRNADYEVRDVQNGRTLLHHVAGRAGGAPLVEALLKSGLAPNSCSYVGVTPLHLAVQAGEMPTIRLMLGWGAAPNLRDNKMNPPLYHCSSLQVACYLVCNGARLELKNERNQLATARVCAKAEEGAKACMKSLKEAQETWAQRADLKSHDTHRSDTSNWIDGEACLLCGDLFSMFNRR
jgi:ankyrin repeat protein